MARIFAISDIHGCFNPFYELVTNVIKLNKSDHLVLLGDYIDRGGQSKEVIDFIIELRRGEYNITALAGNHEVMLLDAFNDPDMFPLWQMNSGLSTLISFGINDIREIGPHYLDFFAKLNFWTTSGEYIFVHAGFDDLAADPFADRRSMIWECRLSYNNPVFSGKTIIHGHRPKTLEYVRKQISEKSKVIPIDTGCVYDPVVGYGNLSALEVNTMDLFSIPNNVNSIL